jgi:hypothetical protein
MCYKDKIYIPQSLREKVLSWYHEYLLHPGQTCTEKTIQCLNSFNWRLVEKLQEKHALPTTGISSKALLAIKVDLGRAKSEAISSAVESAMSISAPWLASSD